MRKQSKIILWITFVILSVFCCFSFATNPGVQTTSRDIFLFRLSGFSMFFILLFGVAIKLNFFGIKKLIPLANSKKITSSLLYWSICIVLSVATMAVINSQMSDEYKIATGAKIKNTEIAYVPETTSQLAPTKPMETIATTTQPVTETTLPEPTIPETTESFTEPTLISEKTFYWSDIPFNVNGVEIIFDRLTLKREYKPQGYMLRFAYQVKNTNNQDAHFSFSNREGNAFFLDGQKGRLYANGGIDTKHFSSMTLTANQIEKTHYTDMFAPANETKQLGDDCIPINIAEIFSNQVVKVTVHLECSVGDKTEWKEVTFDLNF